MTSHFCHKGVSNPPTLHPWLRHWSSNRPWLIGVYHGFHEPQLKQIC